MKTAKIRHINHDNRGVHTLYDDFEKIRDAFSEKAHDLEERASEAFTESVENLKERSNDIKDSVTDYISKEPLKVVGIALLSGLLIGYLSRSHKKIKSRRK